MLNPARGCFAKALVKGDDSAGPSASRGRRGREENEMDGPWRPQDNEQAHWVI